MTLNKLLLSLALVLAFMMWASAPLQASPELLSITFGTPAPSPGACNVPVTITEVNGSPDTINGTDTAGDSSTPTISEGANPASYSNQPISKSMPYKYTVQVTPQAGTTYPIKLTVSVQGNSITGDQESKSIQLSSGDFGMDLSGKAPPRKPRVSIPQLHASISPDATIIREIVPISLSISPISAAQTLSLRFHASAATHPSLPCSPTAESEVIVDQVTGAVFVYLTNVKPGTPVTFEAKVDGANEPHVSYRLASPTPVSNSSNLHNLQVGPSSSSSLVEVTVKVPELKSPATMTYRAWVEGDPTNQVPCQPSHSRLEDPKQIDAVTLDCSAVPKDKKVVFKVAGEGEKFYIDDEKLLEPWNP